MKNKDTQLPEVRPTARVRRYEYHPKQHYVEGSFPDISHRVMTVDDSEFEYSISLGSDFKCEIEHMRRCLHVLFVDRWFGRERDLPCTLRVYEAGAKIFSLNFILHHRVTARFPRTTLELTATPYDWEMARFRAFSGNKRPAAVDLVACSDEVAAD